MKTSSIDKVVGNLSDKEKLAVLAEKERLFKRQNNVRLELESLSKTRDQLKIIEEVNEATNALRRKYGLVDFDVSEENVHIASRETWGDINHDGFFVPETQSILLKQTSRNTRFAVSTFRAMVQFKSYGALQKLTDTGEITQYRSGFVMWPRSRMEILSHNPESGGLQYFQELNDAVVEELTVRYFESHLENPLFKKELEETRQTKAHIEGLDNQTLLDVYDIRRIPKTNHFDLASFTHKAERKALLISIGGSAWKNFFDEVFKGGVVPLDVDNMLHDVSARKAPIFDMFIRPMFTGDLLELSRFINKTFGKGEFRKLGAPNGYSASL